MGIMAYSSLLMGNAGFISSTVVAKIRAHETRLSTFASPQQVAVSLGNLYAS